MKKSKIIIPALALIAFSVAASVTGAVAWFTASRTATISAGSYAVVKTSAELSANVTSGIGTSVENSTVSFDSVLTDASFNHKQDKRLVITPNEAGTGLKMAPGKTASDPDAYDGAGVISLADATPTNMKRGETGDNPAKTIYTIATFDIEFKISFGAVAGDVGLYLDNGAGKTSVTVNGGASPVTATGFRMAFVQKGSLTDGSQVKNTVLADLQTSTNCKYVAGATDTTLAGTAYAANDYDLIDSAYNAALPTIESGTELDPMTRAKQTNRPDFLGFFKYKAASEVKLSYTVVCWFEGTDPNIVNQDDPAKYQKVLANLSFEAINLVDAPAQP